IAPGKKQWTWGNHDFGYAWDRNLTDEDGAYVELMSGVYTDNQPDFSFLAPGETKTFSQYWYPISEIGVPDLANLDAALRVEPMVSSIRIHLQVTSAFPESVMIISLGGTEVGRWHGDLEAEKPIHLDFPASGTACDLVVTLQQGDDVLLRYAPAEIAPAKSPAVATEPPLPAEVTSSDELYLNGLHLEQYRHPTRSPEVYWIEGLRRDPGDSRCNNALGRWHLRRGEFAEAEKYLRAGIARLTTRNPNPYDGEPYYNLGLTLLYQHRLDEAYAAFFKSTWNAAWRGPGYHRLAEIDCRRGAWMAALDHIGRSLRADSDNLNARNLKTIILRVIGCTDEAEALLDETRALDQLDIFGTWLATETLPPDGQQQLDLAFDLMRMGLLEEALSVLVLRAGVHDGSAPLLHYARAFALGELGLEQESKAVYCEAALANPDYVFPSRLEEMILLERGMQANPADARAPYYLGNLLYDRRRHKEAISLWERATELDPKFPTTWRNLGFGYYNVLHDTDRALKAFEKARALAPYDARILYEQDQLLKRTGEDLRRRLATLESHRTLVEKRDDLSVELISLYNSTGRPEEALRLLLARHFQPWEGGEGLVLSQYVRANVLLAQSVLKRNDADAAVDYLKAASKPPQNLSEARHLLMNLSMIDYWLGVAYAANGDSERASAHWQKAAAQKGDFQQMQVQSISETTYWSAMALRKLGRADEARALFQAIFDYAAALEKQTPKIDYFATSLPTMLLFEEDLDERQKITALFLRAQALLGLGKQVEGLALLHDVRQKDHSHTGAIDMLKAFAE
ncbi:MAG TPA: DUF5107 domain-containing protein, partial [Pseudacidobacterium sp.]|nr:DUF5107 domain-containing protein [Pseudacidobacterium sp.]